MKTISIGYERDDGDFAILATLNNNDELMPQAEFEQFAFEIKERFQLALRDEQGDIRTIEMRERQDTPDYVELF